MDEVLSSILSTTKKEKKRENYDTVCLPYAMEKTLCLPDRKEPVPSGSNRWQVLSAVAV